MMIFVFLTSLRPLLRVNWQNLRTNNHQTCLQPFHAYRQRLTTDKAPFWQAAIVETSLGRNEKMQRAEQNVEDGHGRRVSDLQNESQVLSFSLSSDILFLKHASSIFRQSSNPVCGFSMMEQVKLCAVWPTENWLSSSMNDIQGWIDCLNMLLSCFRKKNVFLSSAIPPPRAILRSFLVFASYLNQLHVAFEILFWDPPHRASEFLAYRVL